MPDYRAYQIGEDDRVTSAHEVTADTDEEALVLAREYIDGLDVEVWERGRKVGRLPREH